MSALQQHACKAGSLSCIQTVTGRLSDRYVLLQNPRGNGAALRGADLQRFAGSVWRLAQSTAVVDLLRRAHRDEPLAVHLLAKAVDRRVTSRKRRESGGHCQAQHGPWRNYVCS